MNPTHRVFPARIVFGAFVTALVVMPPALRADGQKKNPSSKVYVSDVNGDAQIDTGENIQDLNKRSVYNAQGTTIETRKSNGKEEKGKVFSTMVYSNGTGAYFDEDTKVEVKKFVQEPFTPNRTDMDVEPSISQTQAVVSRGTVGLCTSKLVAGSSMNYQTPHGSINIQGRKVVIEANDRETKISMLEGESTVRGGEADLGGHKLKVGEQAVIRHGATGQPNTVTVQPIPPSEVGALDDKVAMACMAKKTVYFEIKERQITESGTPAGTVAESVTAAENNASGGSTDTGGTSAGNGGSVTAFDGPAANNNKFAPKPTIVQEIVPVEVVPVNLPVQFTVSPARIVTTKPGG